ncbi:MAG TPA: acyl carrier protein [Gemmatimonadales bacterium]|nr:acyl carrier protein [Gemmatimonadales bacterium]
MSSLLRQGTIVTSEAELVQSVIAWVRDKQRSGSLRDGEVLPDTDLVATGLLDSLGLIELVAFLEAQTGCTIDLTDVDPSEFSVVRGLCRITLRSSQA